jgi:hypothetical protein
MVVRPCHRPCCGRCYGIIRVGLERNEVVDLLPDPQAETLACWRRQRASITMPFNGSPATSRLSALSLPPRSLPPCRLYPGWRLRSVTARTPRVAGAACTGSRTAPGSKIVHLSYWGVTRGGAQDHPPLVTGWRGAALEQSTTSQQSWALPGPSPPLLDQKMPQREFAMARVAEVGFYGPPQSYPAMGSHPACQNIAGQPEQKHACSLWCSLARLVMADPEMLAKAEQGLALHLLGQVLALADAIIVAKRLTALLRRKASDSLQLVLDAATRTPLREFAAGLRRDLGTIQAALDLPWTTSPVEQQVSWLEMLKRTFCGRAGLKALRARVSHAA